jgi:hypothetical protein
MKKVSSSLRIEDIIIFILFKAREESKNFFVTRKKINTIQTKMGY